METLVFTGSFKESAAKQTLKEAFKKGNMVICIVANKEDLLSLLEFEEENLYRVFFFHPFRSDEFEKIVEAFQPDKYVHFKNKTFSNTLQFAINKTICSLQEPIIEVSSLEVI